MTRRQKKRADVAGSSERANSIAALMNFAETKEVSKVAVTVCVTEPLVGMVVGSTLKVGSPSPKSMISFAIGSM